MKTKKIILSMLLAAAFAISNVAYATSSGDHAGGADHGRDPSGADRSGGELNHDNDLQGAEISSHKLHRRHATPVSDLGIGEPTNPHNSYIQSREYMRNHR